MHSYNSLLLSGLLVIGIASNVKSFEYKNHEDLGKFDSEKSYLVAQQGESQNKESRGSGRFAPVNPLSDAAEENLLADAQKDSKESRGSGRFAPSNPLSDLIVQADNNKKESRGSGRFAPVNPLSDATEKNLLAEVQQQNKENRGSGRLAPNHPQFNSSQEDLMAASKNGRRKVVIIYS